MSSEFWVLASALVVLFLFVSIRLSLLEDALRIDRRFNLDSLAGLRADVSDLDEGLSSTSCALEEERDLSTVRYHRLRKRIQRVEHDEQPK